jgi:hypothetical protein
MFADLVQRCQDASFDAQYPEGGSFVRHTRSGLLAAVSIRV